MIKVVKHGNLYEKKQTCSYCGCEFVYEIEDIQEENEITTPSFPVINCLNSQQEKATLASGDIKTKLTSNTAKENINVTVSSFVYKHRYIRCPECGAKIYISFSTPSNNPPPFVPYYDFPNTPGLPSWLQGPTCSTATDNSHSSGVTVAYAFSDGTANGR